MKEGLGYIRRNAILKHVIFLHAFVGVTAYDNLIALMAKYEYKEIMSISLIIGFMNMARAVSLVVGPMILSKFINNKCTAQKGTGNAKIEAYNTAIIAAKLPDSKN